MAHEIVILEGPGEHTVACPICGQTMTVEVSLVRHPVPGDGVIERLEPTEWDCRCGHYWGEFDYLETSTNHVILDFYGDDESSEE